MKKYAILLVLICAMVLSFCGNVTAVDMNTTQLPSNRHIFIDVANDDGIKYNYDAAVYGGPNGTYYIKADSGGLNELHISNSSDTSETFGQVTAIDSKSTNSSGVFYITYTGGRGWHDENILLLSVKGPIPDDFTLHITATGYTWTPTGAFPLEYEHGVHLNETFTIADFLYGPQTAKPGPGPLDVWTIPLYYGQDINDNSTAQYLMFIDLYNGVLKYTTPDLIDNGAIKIEYRFTNLTTNAAFNVYGWTYSAAQGQGISWTNRVDNGNLAGSSGYSVSYDPVTPVADFAADVVSGVGSLTVHFTDASLNYPTSWAWDFDNDGVIDSTDQDPSWTYLSPGTYSVVLTVSNAAGNDTMTKTGYINVFNDTQPNVTATPDSGKYKGSQNVTLISDQSDATIYYTTDGSDPTDDSNNNRVPYSGPIPITSTTNLQFAAVNTGGVWSQRYSKNYVIDAVTPRVTNVDPAKNAVVRADKVIKVTFNEAIKAGSLWIDLKNSNGTLVPVTTSINGNTLTITPKNLLVNGKYSLALHTGCVADLVGNALALYSTSFSVDAVAPKVANFDPANKVTNVSAGKVIKVTFSENIKAGSLWIELLNSAKKAVPVNITINGNILTVDPKSNLAESLYTLCIHTGAVTDLAGNPVALKSSKFSVGTSPVMSKVDPANGATRVARNKNMAVTFNESIKKGSNCWVELKASNGTKIAVTTSTSGKVLTIAHTAKLRANTRYSLIIHTGAVTDLAGNPVAVRSFTFTTGNT